MSEELVEITMEQLNAFLKTLKSSSKRIESIRGYVENFGSNNVHTQIKFQKEYDRLFEEYLELENRLMHLMNACLTDNERDLIVSRYILGYSVSEISLLYSIDVRTYYRWLRTIKIKIVDKSVSECH